MQYPKYSTLWYNLDMGKNQEYLQCCVTTVKTQLPLEDYDGLQGQL